MLMRREYAPERSPMSFSKGGGFLIGILTEDIQQAGGCWFET